MKKSLKKSLKKLYAGKTRHEVIHTSRELGEKRMQTRHAKLMKDLKEAQSV